MQGVWAAIIHRFGSTRLIPFRFLPIVSHLRHTFHPRCFTRWCVSKREELQTALETWSYECLPEETVARDAWQLDVAITISSVSHFLDDQIEETICERSNTMSLSTIRTDYDKICAAWKADLTPETKVGMRGVVKVILKHKSRHADRNATVRGVLLDLLARGETDLWWSHILTILPILLSQKLSGVLCWLS